MREDRNGVRWLVDGMNVIGSRPDGWWHDRTAAMARLVADLDALAAGTREPVSVVFDGHPRPLGDGANRTVEVAFAATPGRGAADDEIARRAAAATDPEALRVVTSDAELAARVTAAGARVVGSGAFRRRLDQLETG